MDLTHDLAGTFVRQPLLALAVLAMMAVVLGGLLRRVAPGLGFLVRGIGNLGLMAALILTVVQVARVNPGFDLPALSLPQQEVSGKETRIPLGRDGHFWIKAEANGQTHRFLVDTGATLTAISPQLAQGAGADPQPMREPVILRTANGTVAAQLATLRELRFGNIVARDLDVVIAPGMEGTSVLGMNFLSRLASWRVEGSTLILVPHHPQATGAAPA